MKKILLATAASALMASGAAAMEIGATFSRFDDNWLTVLRNGMVDYAGTIDGLSYQQEDASDDLAKQIDQVKNFVAQGVDAIIVNIVDTSAGAAVSAAAGGAIATRTDHPRQSHPMCDGGQGLDLCRDGTGLGAVPDLP